MADILSIGSAGLTAYRRSLEVTGNNITNVNTEGYARRDAQLIGVGEATMSPTLLRSDSGNGVTVDVVRRATNTFLQAEAWSATATAAKLEAFSDRMDRLEKTVFSSENDLGTYIQGFFGKVQDLASNPTSLPDRITTIGSAGQLVDRFQDLSRTLTREITAITTDAADQLSEVNAITEQIAATNTQLNSNIGVAQKSNDMLDRRDSLLNQLVKLVGVTIDENSRGAVDVYIGEGTGGISLVSGSDAKTLAVTKSGDSINFVIDPYQMATPIGRLTGGSLAGIVDYNDQLMTSFEQLNRLAASLAVNFNQQHVSGIDLNGNLGQPFFSTDNLKAEPSLANTGKAIVTVDLKTASLTGSENYIAKYDADVELWTITAAFSGHSSSGKSSVLIDGVAVNFSGQPKNGDIFTISPLKNAAAAIRVLVEDPQQLAIALPQLAQSGSANVGSATLSLNLAQTSPFPPSLKPMAIFSQSISPASALTLRNDGVVAGVPSGSRDVRLFSFAGISAAHFVSTNDISIPEDVLNSASPTLSVKVDGVSHSIALFPDGVPSDLAGSIDPMGQLVNEINRALDQNDDANSGISEKVFASSVNGVLTLNALGTSKIDKVTFLDDEIELADGLIEVASPPSNIQIMTREGRQLAGASLTPAEAAALLTETNGFTGEAEYKQTSSTVGYRDISITTTSNPLRVDENRTSTSTSATVSVLAFPEADTAIELPGANPLAGGVYVMAVDGLSTIRLAGSKIAGKGTEDINSLLIDRLNGVASRRSYDGAAIDPNTRSASFTVTINGEDNFVTFMRDVDPDGIVDDKIFFTVEGETGLSAVIVDGKVRLLLPPSLTSAAPSVSFSGDDVLVMGFLGGVTQRLQASGTLGVDLTAESKTIKVLLGGSTDPYNVTISGETGTDARSGVSWSLENGKLVLEADASDPGLSIVSENNEDRDKAVALGFMGSDLTLSINRLVGGEVESFTLASTVRDRLTSTALVDTSLSVSRIGQSLMIHGPIPEDLIIAAKAQPGGSSRLAARFDPNFKRVAPTMPDVDIEVTADGKVEIFDHATGASLATRAFQNGLPVTYMGASFTVRGNSEIGDMFSISTDPTRTGDNRNGLLLAELQNSDAMGVNSGSFQEIYSTEIAKMGATSLAAKRSSEASKSLALSVEAAYAEATGVSLDTEAGELMKFQQAYQACAQVIRTAQTLFDAILAVM